MNVSTDVRPLIVGAGPVGLAAALFLARKGIRARIIDQRTAPGTHSRALAVNPRTLELLEPTGVTARMMEHGLPIGRVGFHSGRKTAELKIGDMHPKYPFLLGLSQSTTERLLSDAIRMHGIQVEYSHPLSACRLKGDEVEVQVDLNRSMTLLPPWVFAADGAKSTVRSQCSLSFDGSTFPEPWHLVDVALEGDLAPDMAHIFFEEGGGFRFLMRMVEDKRREISAAKVWRVMGNQPDPLARTPEMRAAGEPLWRSEFHISHRIIERMAKGPVFFAGDAAHIHSPLGARGMNLGIEDAWVFAELTAAGRQKEYAGRRRRIDDNVVRRIHGMTRVARGETRLSRLLRSGLFEVLCHVAPLRRMFGRLGTGLDHPYRLD